MFRFSMLPSLYVAAAMPPGVETQIVDEDVEPIDFDVEADLIGISFMTFNAPRAYWIADRFREKGKTVIFGGYHPTFMPEEAVRHANAVCLGEAEGVVPRMVEDFLAGGLKPTYRGGLGDLKGLPVPDRRLMRRSGYITADAVQATRGCPHHCRFCSITAFFGNRFRARPVDEVVEEIRPLGRNILFLDDNIAADPGYARELFAKMVPLRKRWFSQCGIRIASDPGLLRLAAASGCRGIFIGLESLSQEGLTGWGKSFSRAADYARAIGTLHAAGIGICAGLMFGADGETPEVFGKALRFLDEARVDALQATIVTPFPGTPLFDEMDRQGRIIDRDWGKYDFGHAVFEPWGMSPQNLEEGTCWVLKRFYSRWSVTRRLASEFLYLGRWSTVNVLARLNLSYRSRLKTNGSFEKGRRFAPPPPAAAVETGGDA